EKALVSLVKNLDKAYTEPTPNHIRTAAGRLLKMSGSDYGSMHIEEWYENITTPKGWINDKTAL
ncbi:hypothetical protein N7447_010966, partial [Penicillium robsamsonii]|uniref:uncharacterized protein n=1 Tax=Penicillium robsamsonii TaxID=1792511 RepID=UPI00254946D5